ncbi:DUF5320 domain-containing protein [Patescibacteria group bacterium]|nr:DUF5320 domain-containing protein [Patescibacteria group bacterium]
MPAQDGTGPCGRGPLTGLGRGVCQDVRGASGFGRGRGFGMRCNPIPERGMQSLDEEEALLRKRLQELKDMKENS